MKTFLRELSELAGFIALIGVGALIVLFVGWWLESFTVTERALLIVVALLAALVAVVVRQKR